MANSHKGQGAGLFVTSGKADDLDDGTRSTKSSPHVLISVSPPVGIVESFRDHVKLL